MQAFFQNMFFLFPPCCICITDHYVVKLLIIPQDGIQMEVNVINIWVHALSQVTALEIATHLPSNKNGPLGGIKTSLYCKFML